MAALSRTDRWQHRKRALREPKSSKRAGISKMILVLRPAFAIGKLCDLGKPAAADSEHSFSLEPRDHDQLGERRLAWDPADPPH